MAEIIINDVKYTNVPNKKAGTKFASALTQSNIGMSQAVQDYVNSSYFYALINAIDINWDGIDIGENTYINTTSDLIKWIESKAGDIDLSSYATVAYVNQKFEDLIGGAPETLDTLKELADALQEDASLAYVTQALEGKANVNDVYTKTEVDNLIPAPVDLSGYVSYTQANSYYVAKEDMPDLNDYATTSYVTTELNKKANTNDVYTKQEVDNMIPEDVDMSNYVSYTQANSYYLKIKNPGGNPQKVIRPSFEFLYTDSDTDRYSNIYLENFTNNRETYKATKLSLADNVNDNSTFIIETNTESHSSSPRKLFVFPKAKYLASWVYDTPVTYFPLIFSVYGVGLFKADNSGTVNLTPAFSNYVSYTQANSYYVAKEDMPDMNDYATTSYVTSELDKKADLSDIPSAPDLTNYVSYTQANSYYMTVKGPKQVINSVKTFVGNKLINFRQSGSTDKLGFTLYNSDEKDVGGLEYRPNTINGNPLISLQHYVNDSSIVQSYLGFRQTRGSNKYHLLAPIPSDVATIETITDKNYKNFFMPLVFKNGSNKVYTDCTGLVDMASLMPDLNDYTTTSYVTTELNKKADKTDIVQADMCETDTTSKSYVLNNPYQYHLYTWYGAKYYCYNLIIPHNTNFVNTNISNSNTKNCVIIGNNHNIYNGLNSCLIQGYQNKIQNNYEVAFGQFNSSTRNTSDSSLKTVFSIGNGDLVSRHNALEVKGDGQIYIADTYNGTPYSLQSRLNSKANANDVYTKTEVDNLIPAPVDLSNYVSYTQANSYYVDINSYNALAARVEELASWIVSYHTPVIQDISLWHTTDGGSTASYMSNNGGETRTLDISDSATHTINFDSNVNDIVMSVNGISTGITVNNTVWPYSIEYTPSMMTEGGNYSFGFSRNMDSSYNAFSSSFAFTVESSTPEPSKQSPSGVWSNISSLGKCIVVAGDTNTVTCTFSGTPASGWSFSESTIAGVTVNTTTGDVSIDPTNMMTGNYHVYAEYPEDSSYNYGNTELWIRVLPSGSDDNFFFENDSYSIDGNGNRSMDIYIETTISNRISWSSSDTGVCLIGPTITSWNGATITYVSDGSATLTATIDDNGTTHTATCTVTCSSMTP